MFQELHYIHYIAFHCITCKLLKFFSTWYVIYFLHMMRFFFWQCWYRIAGFFFEGCISRELNLNFLRNLFSCMIYLDCADILPLIYGGLNIHELLLIREIREICTTRKNPSIRYYSCEEVHHFHLKIRSLIFGVCIRFMDTQHII